MTKSAAAAQKPKRPGAQQRRKARELLDQESRQRKRLKKRRGNPPGSRLKGGAATTRATSAPVARDPRIGSKKPVPLTTAATTPASAQPDEQALKRQLSALENDERLNALLDKLDAGATLSATEQQYVDDKLDQIDVLLTQLGIELEDDADDDADPEEESGKSEDLYQFLKQSR